MCQHQKDKIFPQFILFLLGLVFSFQMTFALPSDEDKPLQITADSSFINYKTGVYTYEGNVKITQGTTQLLADKVVTKNDNHHKMKEAIAYGTKRLAEYSTVPKEGDEPMRAQARVIRFFPPTSMVTLESNVIVTQGENNFNGPLIFYNIKDQVVTAPATKNGRATILIEPKQYEKS
jgi:lipopolysaccharide export system protein LptA